MITGSKPIRRGATINSNIGDLETLVAADIKVIPATEAGVARVNQITLRRASASADWDSRGEYRTSVITLTNNYYRPGDIVRYQNKHWKCLKEHIAPEIFDTTKWDEAFVHMEDNYAAEDFFKNTKPVLYFDKDKDTTWNDGLLGYTNADFTDDAELSAQFHTGTDYLGAFSFLKSIGLSSKHRCHEVLAASTAS